MFSFEVLQMFDKGWSYFNDLFNLADMASTALILFLLITEETFKDDHDMNRQTRMTLAGVAIAFTWFKLFYWMRLFKNFAFFINLLIKTFND